MKRVNLVQVLALLAVVLFSGTAFAQTDPGVRTGAINGQTGATTTNPLPLTSVTAESPQGILEFFQDGLTRFQVALLHERKPGGQQWRKQWSGTAL